MWRSRLLWTTAAVAGGATVYSYGFERKVPTDELGSIKPRLVPGAMVRFSRDVSTVVVIAMDYVLAVRSEEYQKLLTPEEKEEFLNPIHEKSAVRLRDLFCANAGIYIKIGQHMTQLSYLLPQPYVKQMMPMLDKAPQRSIQDVRRVVSEDLGKPVEELFDDFQEVPIASASLAQVHVAKSKVDGKKLAVKIQHLDLRETSRMDVWMIGFLINALYWKYPSVDYRWLVEEVKANLPRELNFLLEGENAEKCQKMMSEFDGVKIPKIHWDNSSKRVLTMDFEEGIPLSDVDRLKREGIDTSKVAQMISSAFCSQIFRHGFVHCESLHFYQSY
jgi:aarF domain-containing kinase